MHTHTHMPTGIGKSALILRFVQDKFIEVVCPCSFTTRPALIPTPRPTESQPCPLSFLIPIPQYDPTVESSYRKLVTDPAGAFAPTMVEILDTAGQEDFSVLREQQLRGGDGFVLVYSVTSPQSFHAVRDFHEQALHHAGAASVFVVAATKCDLDDERAITADEGRELARALDAAFFETSARSGAGVAAPFVELTRRIRERRGIAATSTTSSGSSSPAPDDARAAATPRSRARRGCTLL